MGSKSEFGCPRLLRVESNSFEEPGAIDYLEDKAGISIIRARQRAERNLDVETSGDRRVRYADHRLPAGDALLSESHRAPELARICGILLEAGRGLVEFTVLRPPRLSGGSAFGEPETNMDPRDPSSGEPSAIAHETSR